MKTNKAVIIFSGGLDSTTCLALAKAQGYECYTLTFDYGQRHRYELKAAERIAAHFNVAAHKAFPLAIGEFGGSALTDLALDVPDYAEHEAVPITYVPARNTIFLAIAMGYAETIGAETIFIGASSVDYSGYPDCRPDYFDAFAKMAAIATKAGVEDHPIKITTPLINLSKAQTIELGLQHGVDYSMTISCYQTNQQGLACGRCDSCMLRKKGFAEMSLADPTAYQ